jgi:hypothetical protein
MAEDPRAQMAYRWAAQAHSLAWRRLGFFLVPDAVVCQLAVGRDSPRVTGPSPSRTPSSSRWFSMVTGHAGPRCRI